jgi:hypothetical protein
MQGIYESKPGETGAMETLKASKTAERHYNDDIDLLLALPVTLTFQCIDLRAICCFVVAVLLVPHTPFLFSVLFEKVPVLPLGFCS